MNLLQQLLSFINYNIENNISFVKNLIKLYEYIIALYHLIKIILMKKVILSVAIVLWSIFSFAQKDQENNIVKKRYGFNVGANYTFLTVKDGLPDNALIYNAAGYQFGFFMDYHLKKNIFISPKIEASINKGRVDFTKNDSSVSKYEIAPLSLNLVAHLVYKIPMNKISPYILFGPTLKIPIRIKENIPTNFNSKTNLSIDIGVGLDTKAKYFVFAPEVRYSYGLLNINEHPAIKSLYAHQISLILNFK